MKSANGEMENEVPSVDTCSCLMGCASIKRSPTNRLSTRRNGEFLIPGKSILYDDFIQFVYNEYMEVFIRRRVWVRAPIVHIGNRSHKTYGDLLIVL